MEQFQDALQDPNQILDLKDSHLAVLSDHNKRLKLQEDINSKENMTRCDQDMVEVQNQLGPRDPKEVALTIMGEFLVVKALIQHLTDVMLDDK